jgi:transposase
MEAYSMDLRERVIEAYDAGRGSSRQLAQVFGVSSAWIRKLLRLRRETGSVAAKAYRHGPRPRLSGRQLERLAELVRRHPDATLADLRRRLRVDCSLVTIHRALVKLGLSYKKSHSVPVNRIEKTSNNSDVVGGVKRPR